MNINNLFAPYNFGNCAIANRFVSFFDVLSCLTHNIETLNTITFFDRKVEPGIIMLENGKFTTQKVSLCGNRNISLRGNSDEWQRLFSTIHKMQRSAFVSLRHLGRTINLSSADNEYAMYHFSSRTLSENINTANQDSRQLLPHEMSALDVELIKAEFHSSAKMLSTLGCDGVEIDCTMGSILSQFLSPQTNLRRDIYGGEIANRTKILDQLLESISKIMSSNRISVRISNEIFADIVEPKDMAEMCRHFTNLLNKHKVELLHLVIGQSQQELSNFDCLTKTFHGTTLFSQKDKENPDFDFSQLQKSFLIGLWRNVSQYSSNQNRQFYDWTINNTYNTTTSHSHVGTELSSIFNYGT